VNIFNLSYSKTCNVRKNVTLSRVGATIFSVKTVIISYSECVSVTSVIRHERRMRRISIVSSVASLALPYFSTFPQKGTFFGKQVIQYKILVLILCILLSGIFLILRRNERDIIKEYTCLRVKYPLLFLHFNP